ncbi:protein kinase [Streptomyces sp. NPDC090106]|uniref:protein kinase domain-containing protein n=1 Tax=Streptomyces sp. NPDC090106 TaxID=3365946 RepID=UPI0037F7EEF8
MTDQRQQVPPYSAALRQAGGTPLLPADPARIGPYVPLGRLGSGGMGRVFLARPAGDAPGLAAVKVIRPEYAEDPEFRRRFEREASVHARVVTPYAPRLLGTGFDDELLWMATEYVPGLNLAEAVKGSGPLGSAGVWRLVAELGRALSALADAGVVHRDLKPSNVLLSADSVHVIDFGISQAVDSSAITGTGSRVGTPAFMSPEYLREGRCDGASDVFSLAGTLIYAATGHAPFGDGTGVDVMHRVAFEEPKADIMSGLSTTDRVLATLLAGCLAKDPAGRPTPRQLIDAAPGAQAVAWQDPLGERLRTLRQGYEVLTQVSAEQTVHFRAPAPARPPGFGPPPVLDPTPVLDPAPVLDPGHDTRGTGTRRIRRKPYLALVAGAAVCAVAAGAFFLTRPSLGTAAASSPAASADGSPASAAAGSRPSNVAISPGEAEKDDEDEGKKTDGGSEKSSTAPQASTTPSGTPAGTTPSATGTRGSGGDGDDDGSTPAPTATVTRTASAPATPAWISDCTYYSGNGLTDYGDTGQRVVQVQCMLTKRGYSVGSSGVDGEFGRDTEAAVKQFQSARGLEVDGQVGPKTWAALRSTT